MPNTNAPRRALDVWRTSAAPLGLLALTHFLMHVDRNLPALVLPLLKHRFALSDTALGLAQGPAFVLFFVAATLLPARANTVGNCAWPPRWASGPRCPGAAGTS